MNNLLVLLCCVLPMIASSQEQKPTYYNELPVSYEKGAWASKGVKTPQKNRVYPNSKQHLLKNIKFKWLF